MERILSSVPAKLLRRVLPDSVKVWARQAVRKEIARFPLIDPVVKSIDGISASFWILNSSDWYRIMSVTSEEAWAEDLMGTIKKMPDSVFLDVGAAQGVYSILAAKAGAEVIAYDPDPISAESFVNNLGLNDDVSKNIVFHSAGLANFNGLTTLYIDSNGIYAPSMTRTVNGLKESIEVRVYKLDDLIKSGEVSTPSVIKIDVEGAEKLVLDGMAETLRSLTRPEHIFIEVHCNHLPLFGSSPEEIFNLMENASYQKVRTWERRGERLIHFSCL